MSIHQNQGSRLIWRNGHSVAGDQVLIDADDPGLILGMTVFETLRVYGGHPFALDPHLVRLAQSCQFLAIPFPPDLNDQISGILGAWGQHDGNLRITLTGGGVCILRVAPVPRFPASFSCVTRPWTPPAWLPGQVKHGSRACSQVAVQSTDADEVLWIDDDGYLLEGTRSNILALRGQQIWTPPLDGRILAGITRNALLTAAKYAGWTIKEAPLPLHAEVDEFVLTSTLKELMPIHSIDGKTQIRGKGSSALATIFAAWLKAACHSTNGNRERGP